MNLKTERLQKQLLNPVTQKLFLWQRLPAAAFMGLRVDAMTLEEGVVSLPYGWRSQNPFQSIYFAAQAAAAELSTGLIAMLASANTDRPVSMLVTGMQGTFSKKATSRTTFHCQEGHKIMNAVARARATGEGVTVSVETVGTQATGGEVARFVFTWSFKVKA